MKLLLRLLAFVCEICPFCIVARRFPNSKFASGMAQVERFCPFCSAHKKLNKTTESRNKP